jgi:acetyltransferase-like isoleucine patch superfamily enzyme
MVDYSEVDIHPSVHIECDDITIGKGTIIGPHTRLVGTKISIGRDSWIGSHALIGGGSAFDPQAILQAGDFFHLGDHGEVNIARGVYIGDEVGLGVQTRIFTHGAWLSEIDGFPANFDLVNIESRVWIPNGQVNPGVSLGNDSVYIPGSVVSESQPSNALIGGNPAKVIKENYYPRSMMPTEKTSVMFRIGQEVSNLVEYDFVDISSDWPLMIVNGVTFDLSNKTIQGEANKTSEIARQQLRRHGIRFKYEVTDGQYVPW